MVHYFSDGSGTVCFNATTGQSLVFAIGKVQFESIISKNTGRSSSDMDDTDLAILNSLRQQDFLILT